MITPGDITNELIERANGEIRANCGPNPPTDCERVAAILNAAIEAGLVSPAVKIARRLNGKIMEGWDGFPILFASDGGGTTSDDDEFKFEHWKGQTE